MRRPQRNAGPAAQVGGILRHPHPAPSIADTAPRALLLSAAGSVPLMEGLLATGASFRFRASGSSMFPFVRDGDIICISPLDRPPSPGDVVGFVHPESGGLVVHRVVACGDGVYRLRGDNACRGTDDRVTSDRVLGRVTDLQRHSRPIRFGFGPERRVVALLSRLGWLPPLTAELGHLKRLLEKSGEAVMVQ